MSYTEDFIELTKQPENCESDNWTDAVNFVGKMEAEIQRIRKENEEIMEALKHIAEQKQSYCGAGASKARSTTCDEMRKIAKEALGQKE